MEQRDLGGTGLKSSRLILGTMTFGSQVDQQEANAMVDAALEAGINHFDTANVYNDGAAEAMLGRALGKRRGKVIVATKVRGRFAEGPDGIGLSRAAILRAIDGSLERLGTDYVDLYYLHQPDRSVRIEETLATLGELVAAGKVRQVGFSNYSAWQVADMLHLARANGWPELRVGQQLYNPISRGLDEDYAEFAVSHKVSTVIYNPLAGGLLTGKHRGRSEPLPGRFQNSENYRARYWSPILMTAVERAAAIADRASCSLVELTFAWLLEQPVADGVILGASSLAQLQTNLAAAAKPAPSLETLQALDELWAEVRGPFPRYSR